MTNGLGFATYELGLDDFRIRGLGLGGRGLELATMRLDISVLNRARNTNRTSLILWCNAVHQQTDRTNNENMLLANYTQELRP